MASGSPYYYWGGTYYATSGTRYVVVDPPLGAVVYAVPAPTTVVYANSQPYYYTDGTYYVASDEEANLPEENPEYEETQEDSGQDDPEMIESDEHNYEVVAPPVGATVPYLPEETEKKTIDEKTYYVKDGTYYRSFASDGDTVYMVVDDPTKAGE